MEIPVLYEDNFLFVVDKPAGIVVNRAETVKAETVQDWAEKRIPNNETEVCNPEKTDFYNRAGIVHRLDKETSGLLIIAKTKEAFFNLQGQFKERTITKKYLALVHGMVTPDEGEIKASVARLPWNRERFGIVPGGREAITSYRVLSRHKGNFGSFSLLSVFPHTGRTHQIRVHLKYLGFPVVSDSLYGGRKTLRSDLVFCPRLFLHAVYLRFRHPQRGDWIEVESKLPDELEKVIGKLS